jgi:hypothetical protein
MSAVTGKMGEDFFQGRSPGAGLQGGGCVIGNELSLVQHGDAIGQKFDFRKHVRGEEQGSALARNDLGFEEPAEVGSRKDIQTASGLVEQENLRLMKNGSEKAQPLHVSCGNRANLAVQDATQFELRGGGRNPLSKIGIGKTIEPPKKTEILTSCESWIETEVGTSVVANLAPDCSRFAHRIESRHARGAARREKKRGEDTQERGFSGAICSEQRHGFALLHLQGNAAKRGHRRCGERLNKGAPAAVGRRKRFFERVGGDGRFGHYRGYSVSVARKQCGPELFERGCMGKPIPGKIIGQESSPDEGSPAFQSASERWKW